MISLERAAHIAELITSIISLAAILPTCWKVWRFVDRLMKALHDHTEEKGALQAAGIKRLFAVAKGD